VLSNAEIATLYRGVSWGYSYAQLFYAKPSLTYGITAWWDMTDASGNATASVGTALTATNTPTTLPLGVILPEPFDAYGARFDGTANRLNLGNPASLNVERTTPQAGLVILNTAGSPSSQSVITKIATGVSGWKFTLLNNFPHWRFTNAAGTQTMYRTGGAAVTSGTPAMLGWTKDNAGSAPDIYMNGALSNGATGNTWVDAASATVPTAFIGGNVDGTEYYTGDMGLVAVFNTAKTAIDFRRWATEGGFL
jgi:hypothetical protein